MNQPILIVLVDDHSIVRNGLKSLIEAGGEFKVIGEFENGRQFVEALPVLPSPDLAILDLNMPEMNGADTVKWLQKNKPEMKTLILTIDTEEKTIINLFRLGIRGYLPKNCSAQVLKKAIMDIVTTGFFHSELLQQALTADMNRTPQSMEQNGHISEREMAFLQLVCDESEYTYEKIADLLGVSRRTVDGYRESLFEKLHVRSKIGLVLYAIRNKLVDL